MPSPRPLYEDGVPKSHCRVRSCNEEGQEWPGQVPAFPYAHPTDRTGGVVKRKPVFSHDADYTFEQLELAFEGVGMGADYERCSEATQRLWCRELDRCDLQAVDYHSRERYVDDLLRLCDRITLECTGHDFQELGIIGKTREELGVAWSHFIREIWMRDPEWEDLIRCLSDPNREWSVDQPYYLHDPDAAVRQQVADRLLLPLQVWNCLLSAAALAFRPTRTSGFHRGS
mmetsp:Transcript_24319/g.54137  ORF Transcript_24319/g.54137 Transcript_24319/m.54137 type:complete len:229 (+) Transcript_24319:84-770(+)